MLKSLELASALFTSVAGCLLHFVYQWSGRNRVVGLFAPVSESTWEHLKLLFFPMLLSTAVEAPLLRQYPDFPSAKLLGVLAGMLSIVAIFYTYSGILGSNLLALDILTFLIGAWICPLVTMRLCEEMVLPFSQAGAWLGFALLALAFGVLTRRPPRLGLFADPTPRARLPKPDREAP